MEAGIQYQFSDTPLPGTNGSRRFNASRILGLARALERVEQKVGDYQRVYHMVRLQERRLRGYDSSPAEGRWAGTEVGGNRMFIVTDERASMQSIGSLSIHELGHVFDSTLQQRRQGPDSQNWHQASG